MSESFMDRSLSIAEKIRGETSSPAAIKTDFAKQKPKDRAEVLHEMDSELSDEDAPLSFGTLSLRNEVRKLVVRRQLNDVHSLLRRAKR